MILIRNNAVLTTPVAIPATLTRVPFDTVVYKTNGSLTLDDSAVAEYTPGMYDTFCQVTVSNASSSAAATVTLQEYADGVAVPGATAIVTVAASGSAIITLPWATRVLPAAGGVAKTSWYLSGGAVNLNNAIAKVKRVI